MTFTTTQIEILKRGLTRLLRDPREDLEAIRKLRTELAYPWNERENK